MVAVELAIPQAAILSVSKLMGSEGLGVGAGGGVGISVANVDETQLGCNSIESRPSVDVEACSRTGILKNVIIAFLCSTFASLFFTLFHESA